MNKQLSKTSINDTKKCSALDDLLKSKHKRNAEDILIQEVYSIVRRSIINTKNILQNLDVYKQIDYLLDDNEIEEENIFTLNEIEKICVAYRLVFFDFHYFKKEIPAVAEIKLEYLNNKYQKTLTGLKIISYRECFTDSTFPENYGMLFAPTINGHYYLIHQWGNPISKTRKWKYYPLRSFETLVVSVMIFTLIVDLILPTHLITLDRTATYWCGYRLGVYFHLLIFFSGFTMFIVMSFFKNLSKNIWNKI